MTPAILDVHETMPPASLLVDPVPVIIPYETATERTRRAGWTILDRMRDRVQSQPQGEAFVFLGGGDERRVDYAAFIQNCARYATVLHEEGLEPGDLLLIVLQHHEHIPYAFFGAMLIGAMPAIPAPPTMKLHAERWAGNFAKIVATTAAKRVLTYEGLAAKFTNTPIADRVRIRPDIDAVTPLAELEWHRPQPGDSAFLQFSSGTTGLQKSVALSHGAVMAQIDAYGAAIHLREQDRIVTWLPLYHDMGLVACTLLPLLSGIPFVWMSPFEWVQQPRMLLEAVTQYGGTLCWMPNFAFSFLAKSLNESQLEGLDLSGMRGWINCSEPIHARSFEAFLERFGRIGVQRSSLATCYAMAENTFAVTQSLLGEGYAVDVIDSRVFHEHDLAIPVDARGRSARKQVSSGRCIPGVDVTVRSDDGQVVPERTVGRIFVRGESQFGGYWPDTTSLLGEFYDTGDSGYLAGEELYVVGRTKDTIICRGRNFYPQDIEDLVGAHPRIIPGRVVAVGIADQDLGTQDVLVIAETNAPDLERLTRDVRERCLESLELPAMQVKLVPPGWLIKTSSGKIARSANLQKYASCLQTPTFEVADRPATAEPGDGALARLLSFAQSRMPRGAAGQPRAKDRIAATLDSLAVVELFAFVEGEFGARCGRVAGDIAESGSFADLAAYIEGVRDGNHAPAREDKLTSATIKSKVIEIAVCGDDSLAALCVNEELQGQFAERRPDRWLNISIVFRRRLDCMISDLRTFAEQGIDPGEQWWSPDLHNLLRADWVVIDCFAEMLCTPEIRLRRSDDAGETSVLDRTAIRWLPAHQPARVDALYAAPARLLTPEEFVDRLDELSGLIDGRLVVLTYGEDCTRTFAWSGWLADVNRTLRRRSADPKWRLCDTGLAMDALPHRHYRPPFVPLPETHATAAKSHVLDFLVEHAGGMDRPDRRVVAGVAGRRRAAHSCTRWISDEWLDRWARWYRRVAIAGEPFSCSRLAAALAERGVVIACHTRPEDIPFVQLSPSWDAILLTSGSHDREQLDRLAERHGWIPIEGLLTQWATLTDQERMFRLLLGEVWRRLGAAGRRVGLYGAGAFARYFLRCVAPCPGPDVLWCVDDAPEKQAGTLHGFQVQSPDSEPPSVDAVLVLSDRDKDFQRRALDRFEKVAEVICPAAGSTAIPSPKCWTFMPQVQETFMNPAQTPVLPFRWNA